MKTHYYLAVLLLFALVFTACSSAAPTPVINTQATQPASSNQTSKVVTPPAESNAYPAPVSASSALPTADASLVALSLYPEQKSGDQIDWTAAQAMILNGEVIRVTVDADQKITIDLKDGRSLVSTEPQANAVKETISACGSACQNVLVVP